MHAEQAILHDLVEHVVEVAFEHPAAFAPVFVGSQGFESVEGFRVIRNEGKIK